MDLIQELNKDRYPKPGELILATVKSIYPYGAFCTLDEYPNKEAFVHVSEVAPRWIKNIHEFLSEGQHLVLRVIRVDEEKGHIDASLKRVTRPERERKLDEVRKNKRAIKLIELAGKKARVRKSTLFKVLKILDEEYDGDFYFALEDIQENGEEVVKDLGLPKGFGRRLVEVVQTHLKKPTVKMMVKLKVMVFEPNGVDILKKALGSITKGDKVRMIYAGAPNYELYLIGEDYKTLEKEVNKIITKIEKGLSSSKHEFSYEKVKQK